MKSDDAWTWYGANAPYFGVLTHPRFRDAGDDGPAREAFFDLGESDIEDIFAKLRSDIDRDFAPRHALDFGCGVGRLTIPLARRCETATGVDVSDGMLAEARRNASAFGLPNTRFQSARNGWPVLPAYDCAISLIVFQHIPRAAGMPLFRAIVEGLQPGGWGAIEVPLDQPWRARYHHRKAILRESLRRKRLELLGRPVGAPIIEMNAYDIDACLRLLHDAGCAKVTLHFRDHAGFKAVMLLFRKG
jgi:SAM-dependent methyltransferase